MAPKKKSAPNKKTQSRATNERAKRRPGSFREDLRSKNKTETHGRKIYQREEQPDEALEDEGFGLRGSRYHHERKGGKGFQDEDFDSPGQGRYQQIRTGLGEQSHWGHSHETEESKGAEKNPKRTAQNIEKKSHGREANREDLFEEEDYGRGRRASQRTRPPTDSLYGRDELEGKEGYYNKRNQNQNARKRRTDVG